jgi:hypothetical protein
LHAHCFSPPLIVTFNDIVPRFLHAGKFGLRWQIGNP